MSEGGKSRGVFGIREKKERDMIKAVLGERFRSIYSVSSHARRADL